MTEHKPQKLIKKGRLNFSPDSKATSLDPKDKQAQLDNEFIELIRQIEKYADFVDHAAMTLGTVQARELRSFDILAKLGIREAEINWNAFNLVIYDKVLESLKPIRENLKLLRTEERLSTEKGSEKNIQKLGKLTELISENADCLIKLNKDIDPKKSDRLNAENMSMLSKITNGFISCINKVKSLFGFHDALKHEILGDLDAIRSNAKANMSARLE